MDAFFGSKPSTTEGEKDQQKPSNSELFSSAKLVAEAAKSTFSNESDKVDKGKVAGAAEDLLSAAEDYGKLGEKGYGKYVDKAEEYLHQYSSTAGGHPTTTEAPPAAAPAEEKPAESGGVGDVMKVAGSFFK